MTLWETMTFCFLTIWIQSFLLLAAECILIDTHFRYEIRNMLTEKSLAILFFFNGCLNSWWLPNVRSIHKQNEYWHNIADECQPGYIMTDPETCPNQSFFNCISWFNCISPSVSEFSFHYFGGPLSFFFKC